MTLTSRDKKLALVIIPIALILAYWFLLLSPKREEAAKAGEALAEQQQKRDDAVAKLNQAASARLSFASDYAAVVRLGKAIPSEVDMPSLLVQLDRGARGTEIDCKSIKATPQSGSGGGAASSSASSGSSSSTGGSGGGSTSGSGSSGAQPAAGGAQATGGGAPGLETVPLEFTFVGSYFDLAKFFHRMKRFVYVANDHTRIRGRLMTLDSMAIQDKRGDGRFLEASFKSTIYLSPEKEGVSGGATSKGPGSQPAGSPGSGPSSSPTTAAVTR